MNNMFPNEIFRPIRNYRYAKLRVAMVLLLGSAMVQGSALAQTAQKQLMLPPISSSMSTNLMQLPPTEPTIAYENGLLTIFASNSTLSDVLRGVQEKTGAEIDIPLQSEERVATRLGPGLARDVLDLLLNGSRFNYVLVGSNLDSKVLTKVLLFLKPFPEHLVSQEPSIVTQSNTQQSPAFVSETAQTGVQQTGNPSDPTSAVRDQQQMLRQYRQTVMQQFRQKSSASSTPDFGYSKPGQSSVPPESIDPSSS